MRKLKTVGIILLTSLVLMSSLSALTLEGDPFFVTPDIIGPAYATYVIESVEDVESPMPGRLVKGHWNETKAAPLPSSSRRRQIPSSGTTSSTIVSTQEQAVPSMTEQFSSTQHR